jgi:hypothetical protein
MPVYYFNVYNDAVTIDDEGADLADVDAARAHAVKAARALAADSVLHGHFTASDHISFVDQDRNAVGSVRFDEAVDIRR